MRGHVPPVKIVVPSAKKKNSPGGMPKRQKQSLQRAYDTAQIQNSLFFINTKTRQQFFTSIIESIKNVKAAVSKLF